MREKRGKKRERRTERERMPCIYLQIFKCLKIWPLNIARMYLSLTAAFALCIYVKYI